MGHFSLSRRKMKYISSSGLKALSNYKYHGVDNSLLANYVMQPFWRKAVNLLPIWIAPNLVTLLGFFAIVASYLVMWFYCPQIQGAAPGWAYLFAGVSIFWYQTMDALDGKQARRTGTSSPLGELFDHGCDAMSTTFIGLTLACVMRLGSGWFFFSVVLSSYCVFFMAQWEEYQTGIMELGYMNVTEIQLVICGLYLASWWWGTDMWVKDVSIMGYHMPLNLIPASVILAGTMCTMAGNVVKILRHKNVNLGAAFAQLIPLSLLVIGAFGWACVSPTNVAETHPHEFFLIVGFIFSYITVRH